MRCALPAPSLIIPRGGFPRRIREWPGGRTVFAGIPVRRVRMYVPGRPSGRSRLLSDLSFLQSLVRRGTFPGWRPNVVLTALPMLSQCLAQRFLYRGRGIPRLIVVQDFVVDAALELGILRLPGMSRILRSVERWALRSARTLLTISPLMLEKLRALVGPDRRTCYVPNWIHRSLRLEIERQSVQPEGRRPLSLFYSGNLGVKQGLPGFLRQFRAADSGWSLRIHGGGAERARLVAEVERTPGCTSGAGPGGGRLCGGPPLLLGLPGDTVSGGGQQLSAEQASSRPCHRHAGAGGV